MSVEKRAIRRELRDQRRALPERIVEAAAAAVLQRLRDFAAYGAALSVVAYIGDENEIRTDRLIEAILRSGQLLYLPRQERQPGLARWEPGTPLVAGPGGIPEPPGDSVAVLPLPALALVPVVAWDTEGTRLGRGGGFYDRLFARLEPSVVRVGLAYEFQYVPGLPREAWDVPLHYVITERRTIQCAASSVDGTTFQKGGLRQ